MANALLLSAYDADSHQHWRHAVTSMVDEYDWTQVVLPARQFAWHSRGAPLIWHASSAIQGEPEVVLASATVDLNRLLGLYPQLARARLVLYFHDNQFVYPRRGAQQGHRELQLASIYAAATADRLAFNSQYNQQSFLNGVRDLMQALPRNAPTNLVQQLQEKSWVVPVPIEAPPTDNAPGRSQPGNTEAPIGAPADQRSLILTWAARWEYDKGPDKLLAVVRELTRRGVNFRLNIIGRQFRNCPKELLEIREVFPQCLLHFGYLSSRSAYWHTLRSSHVFLSTAAHEFQGLAALEATAAGCFPLVPDDLVYPDIYPEDCRYRDPEHLTDLCESLQKVLPVLPEPQVDLQRFSAGRLRKLYQQLLA